MSSRAPACPGPTAQSQSSWALLLLPRPPGHAHDGHSCQTPTQAGGPPAGQPGEQVPTGVWGISSEHLRGKASPPERRSSWTRAAGTLQATGDPGPTRRRPFFQESGGHGNQKCPRGWPDPSTGPRMSFRNTPRGGILARLTRIMHAAGLQFPGSCFKATGSGIRLARQAWRRQARFLGLRSLTLRILSLPTGHRQPPARSGGGDHPGRPPTQRPGTRLRPPCLRPFPATFSRKEPDHVPQRPASKKTLPTLHAF